MAGVLSKTITDDFLTCTICLEIFSDPKSLSCLHSFCLECLQNTAKKTPRARGASTGILQCPLCRTETTIPSSGLEGLKTNFLLLGLGSLLKEQKSFSQKATVCEYCLEDGTEVPAYAKCLDCEEFICERCARVHQRSKATKEHGIVTMDDLKSEKGQNTVRSHCRVLCAAHPKEQVKFFCKSCDKAICVNCRLLDHINHECGQLEDLVTEFKAEIEGLIPGVSTKMDSVQGTLQNVDQLQESADDYSDKVSSEIKDQSAMLHAIINSLEKQLLDKVENGKAQNRKQLQAYKEGLQLTLAAMESTTKYAVNLVKYGNPAEISSMKTQCQERLIHLRDVKVDGLPNLQKLVFKAGAKAGADRNRIIEGFGRLLTEEELETDQPPDSSAPASLIDLTNTEASDEDKRKNKLLVGSLEVKGTVKTPRVASAMASVVRGHFSPNNPYLDKPQQVGHGATISAPHMHGATLELMVDRLQEGARCLDVGMGSGYLTACMAIMAGRTGYTVGIDIVEGLVKFAEANMKKDPRLRELMDTNHLVLVCADGKDGHEALGPYDVIHVGGAAPEVPSALTKQLKVGGCLVMPVGTEEGQTLKVVEKQNGGTCKVRNVLNVIYQQLK